MGAFILTPIAPHGLQMPDLSTKGMPFESETEAMSLSARKLTRLYVKIGRCYRNSLVYFCWSSQSRAGCNARQHPAFSRRAGSPRPFPYEHAVSVLTG
jgi:hypothetical protein